MPALSRVLSIDEQQRAARFPRAAERDAFVLRRGWLRTVLSRYGDLEPSAITFTYGRFDKPFLRRSDRTPRLSFSLAQSADLVLIVVAAGRAVGVDVEVVDSTRSLDAVAKLYLVDGEAITRLPPAQKPTAFALAWTRQEAYLKAKGTGLTGAPADYRAAHAWMVETVAPLPGYIGAVAARGWDWRINWHSASASAARCSVRQVT